MHAPRIKSLEQFEFVFDGGKMKSIGFNHKEQQIAQFVYFDKIRSISKQQNTSIWLGSVVKVYHNEVN